MGVTADPYRLDALLDLIADLTDPESCSYDHHGYCQAHSLDEKPCPHERANALLAKRADAEGAIS